MNDWFLWKFSYYPFWKRILYFLFAMIISFIMLNVFGMVMSHFLNIPDAIIFIVLALCGGMWGTLLVFTFFLCILDL